MRRLAIAAAVLVVAASLSARASAAERVYVAPGKFASAAVYRPKAFWASGDATLRFRAIVWSAYGGARATARAGGGVNDCTPDCAEGRLHYAPVRLRFDRVKRTCGRLFYTRMHITWTGVPPLGLPRSSYFLPGVPITC